MRYLIIGLGIYGTNLARDLTDMGHEVIGADINPATIEAIKDYISTTYIVDTTEEASMDVLPLRNVDLVIVAIGENFGASIKTVALLKKMRVPRIYARAIDEIHETILASMDIKRILTPEQRAARDLVNEMAIGTYVDSLAVDHENYVLKFELPEYFHGMLYRDMPVEQKYGLKIVAATRPVESANIFGVRHKTEQILDFDTDSTLRAEPGDIVVCFGSEKGFHKLFKAIN